MSLILSYILIFTVRLLPVLLLKRRPFTAAILLLSLDLIDYGVISFLFGEVRQDLYQTFDKISDMTYLSFELYISLQWQDLRAKNVSIFLFMYRLIGFIVFEIFRIRTALIVFTNMFEYFFLYIEGRALIKKKWQKKWNGITVSELLVVLSLLLPFKIYQELYVHHGQEFYFEIPQLAWNISTALIVMFILYFDTHRTQRT